MRVSVGRQSSGSRVKQIAGLIMTCSRSSPEHSAWTRHFSSFMKRGGTDGAMPNADRGASTEGIPKSYDSEQPRRCAACSLIWRVANARRTWTTK